jgi:3-deoxy-D-manno-octulosonic-acid transferase
LCVLLPCLVLYNAALGKAVVFGPGMSNFREMASLFLQAQAVRQFPEGGLAGALIELLTNSRARRVLGERAALTCRQNQGAAENTVRLLATALG